jgi:hypothetical protein
MAYFDLDTYLPTRNALNSIKPYLTRGSILAFDELAHKLWPGETAALRDCLGLSSGEIRYALPGRSKYNSLLLRRSRGATYGHAPGLAGPQPKACLTAAGKSPKPPVAPLN